MKTRILLGLMALVLVVACSFATTPTTPTVPLLEIVVSTLPPSPSPVPPTATSEPCAREALQIQLDQKATEMAGQPTQWLRVVKVETVGEQCAVEFEPKIGLNEETWFSVGSLIRDVLEVNRFVFVYQYTEKSRIRWDWYAEFLVHPENQSPPRELVAILVNVSDPVGFFVWPDKNP